MVNRKELFDWGSRIEHWMDVMKIYIANKSHMNWVYFPSHLSHLLSYVSLSYLQGLYIFLVYAVYNSEVRKHSVHCERRSLSPLWQNIRMYLCEAAKSVGVNTVSHLGEECHKEDQRKEKGLIFHGE